MSETYKFLDYELCTANHSLKRHRKRVGLRPKTIATLEYLIANRHRVVSKDDLLNAIWPNAHVQEQAVFQSICELRTVFGGETCIETIRGRGYRWIVPLDSEHEHKRRYRWARAMLATTAVFAVAIGAWLYASDRPSALTVVIRPATSSEQSQDPTAVASSVDNMLVLQLRRMGWNAKQEGGASLSPDSVALDIRIQGQEEQMQMDFKLLSGQDDEAGQIVSPTPLGAVRDLALELHESLSFRLESSLDPVSLSRLFRRAKVHLDNENYDVAEAYLVVLSKESPSHIGVKTALAYAYQQQQRPGEALALARAAHSAAKDPVTQTDRMMSANLLSRLLRDAGRYAESEAFARDALEIATEINDLLIVAEAQEQLGELSIARGELGKGKEQLNFALRYYSSFCPSGEVRVSNRLLDLELTPPSIT